MRQIYLIAGLGFGDEGKGSVVDALTRISGAKLIIRYNGGAQAAHNVVLPDGRHHCFAQFGSGSFVPGVQTLLSRHMLVEPYTMRTEAKHLESVGVKDPLDSVFVERGAVITTPFHIASNRLHEIARNQNRHGSCGMGIGETRRLATRHNLMVKAEDLLDRETAKKRLKDIQEILLNDTAEFRKNLPNQPNIEQERYILVRLQRQLRVGAIIFGLPGRGVPTPFTELFESMARLRLLGLFWQPMKRMKTPAHMNIL